MLLLSETLSLLVSICAHVVCCIYLEKVEPTLSLLVFKVMRADIYYSIINFGASVSTAATILLPVLPSVLAHLLLLTYFAM